MGIGMGIAGCAENPKLRPNANRNAGRPDDRAPRAIKNADRCDRPGARAETESCERWGRARGRYVEPNANNRRRRRVTRDGGRPLSLESRGGLSSVSRSPLEAGAGDSRVSDDSGSDGRRARLSSARAVSFSPPHLVM